MATGAQEWSDADNTPPTTVKKRSPMPIIIVIVIALLAAVAVGFLVSGALGGDDAEVTIEDCVIESDGTLTASGTLESSSDVDGTLEVRFDDADNGTEVDRADAEVSGDAGEPIAWSATGKAGDDVKKVTCVVGPLS